MNYSKIITQKAFFNLFNKCSYLTSLNFNTNNVNKYIIINYLVFQLELLLKENI